MNAKLIIAGEERWLSNFHYEHFMKIEFWDCYCVGFLESMTLGSSPMQISLRLSPAITRNRKVVKHEKSWKVSDLNGDRKAPMAATSTEIEKVKLLVKKLEGPFSADGKIVEELIMGNSYLDRKSTRLNSSHVRISYAVF